MKNKIIVWAVVALVGFGIGYFAFSGSEQPVTSISTGTSQTFSSAKIAEVGFTPTTASATTSVVLLNTDSTDRIVTDVFAACSGVGTSNGFGGVASLVITFGTTTNTSNSNSATSPFTVTLATSSPNVYASSATDPNPTVGRVWASGTYWLANINATNTASCVVGNHYLAS